MGRMRLLEKSISAIKDNTCILANQQSQKIKGLYKPGNLEFHRIDATQVFLKEGDEASEAWENLVMKPAATIIDQFL